MRTLSIVFVLLFLSFCSVAADTGLQWKKAVAFYEQKEYDSAAYYFEQLATAKPKDAVVYYNLGNSYYRLNRIAPAVLNYERALKIDPGYKEAKDNLSLTQNRIPNRIAEAEDIFFVDWWHSLTSARKAATWAVLALISFILIIIISYLRKFNARGRSIPAQVTGVTAFLFFCFLVLAFVSANNSYGSTNAVVMENDIPLMSTAGKGKPLALIPEGTTVKMQEPKDNWIEVTLPDGRSGWVQQMFITPI